MRRCRGAERAAAGDKRASGGGGVGWGGGGEAWSGWLTFADTRCLPDALWTSINLPRLPSQVLPSQNLL